jgi:hypothetical protein
MFRDRGARVSLRSSWTTNLTPKLRGACKAKGIAHKLGIAGFQRGGDTGGLPSLRVERARGIEASGFHCHGCSAHRMSQRRTRLVFS